MSNEIIVIQGKDPEANLSMAMRLLPAKAVLQALLAEDLAADYVKINPAVSAMILCNFEPLRRPQWLGVKKYMEADPWVIQTHASRKKYLAEIPRPIMIILTASEGFRPVLANTIIRVIRGGE